MTRTRGHDPGAMPGGRREVRRGCPTASRHAGSRTAAAAVVAAERVARRRRRLPAERGRAAQDGLVLGRLVGRRGGRDLGARRWRRRPTRPRRRRGPSRPCSVRHASRTWLGAAIVVIQLTSVPPPDPGAGEQRDRAVPGRQQAAIQVQPGEGVQLVRRHRRLVDERSGLQDDDRATRHAASIGGDDPATRPGADDDDIRIEDHRLVGRARRRRAGRGARWPWGPRRRADAPAGSRWPRCRGLVEPGPSGPSGSA